MAIKHATILKQHGFEGNPSDFRRALTEIKDAHYPNMTDEELTYTRDEADVYCTAVRQRTGLAALPRPFILRSLIGVRKHPLKV
jgi:hypothetical protein